MDRRIRKLAGYARENKIALVLFLISTLYFTYQHWSVFSWDFSSYALNARYWFSDGTYFETLRPPVAPIVIGLFSIFGWKAAEYLFIISVSFLFMYSSIRLARALGFNSTAFYALSLNAFLLYYGLLNGTELLSLALVGLSVALLVENNVVSGLSLGLSALSRYTNLALFPMLFLHLKAKQAIKSLLLFGSVVGAWLIFNYFSYGNLFTSIADQYANNILYRDYLMQQMQPAHFLQVQNILLPLFFLGIGVVLYKTAVHIMDMYSKPLGHAGKSRGGRALLEKMLLSINLFRAEIIMAFLLFYSVYSYYSIPVKHARFLFGLMLPSVYFSYIGLELIAKKVSKKKSILAAAAMAIFIINAAAIAVHICSEEANSEEYNGEEYGDAIDALEKNGLSDCLIRSNSWVMLNYLGRPTLPTQRIELTEKNIDDGQILVLFTDDNSVDFAYEDELISTLPVIEENDDFVIIGRRGCTQIGTWYENVSYDNTYLGLLDSEILSLHGYHISTSPCLILFHDSPLLERMCNFANLKGFRQDDYRTMT